MRHTSTTNCGIPIEKNSLLGLSNLLLSVGNIEITPLIFFFIQIKFNLKTASSSSFLLPVDVSPHFLCAPFSVKACFRNTADSLVFVALRICPFLSYINLILYSETTERRVSVLRSAHVRARRRCSPLPANSVKATGSPNKEQECLDVWPSGV